MSIPQSLQLRVGVDVGSRCHNVAVGLTDGGLLEEFEIPHTAAGFQDFFARIEGHAKRHPYPIAVAMEGYNGHARPLDSLVRARGWRLFNVNNLKLARFKEIFPAAAKSDRIDSAKTLELFQLRDHLPMAGDVLQECMLLSKCSTHAIKNVRSFRAFLLQLPPSSALSTRACQAFSALRAAS